MASSRLAVRLAALSCVGVTVFATLAPLAHAEPSERTRSAQAELDRLAGEVEAAVEDFNEGRIELAHARREAARVRARVIVAEARLVAVQQAIASVAAAAYRSGAGDQMLQLMTSAVEPAEFLNRAGLLDQVAEGNAERLRDLRAARHELAAIQAEAVRQYDAEMAVQRKLTRARQLIEASAARQEKLVATFVSADERAEAARVAAAERAAAARRAREEAAADAAAAAARRARAARASRDRARLVAEPGGDEDHRDSEQADDEQPDADVPVTGRGAAAVRYAYAQVGKPYRWGGDGPGSFDCSGLTMRAWGAAGVSLSHSSRAQIGQGRRVSRSELQPGDLVFFGSPIHHVGIYVGGGMMINAPQSGDHVRVRSAQRGDYAGAVRPG